MRESLNSGDLSMILFPSLYFSCVFQMVCSAHEFGWHHRLNGPEFEQILGDSEGQGSLECCSPWSHKELDVTKRLNNSYNHQRSVSQVLWAV